MGESPGSRSRRSGHSGATAPVSHRLPRTIALMAANLSNGSARSGAPIRESPQIATSMTRLTLVRHAPSDATRRSAFPLDEPLDARGRDEARALAPRLGRFDVAWTSPAARARQTAEALGLVAAAAAGARRVRLRRVARAHAGRARRGGPGCRGGVDRGPRRGAARRRVAARAARPGRGLARRPLGRRRADGGRHARGRHPRGARAGVGRAGSGLLALRRGALVAHGAACA